jgi:PAS domain S-box-containing protein
VKKSVLTTRTWVLLIVAALLVAAGALNFAQRMRQSGAAPPTDGIEWAQNSQGVFARRVMPDSAGGRAGILPGDRLIAVSEDAAHYEQIGSAPDVQIYLEEAGVGGTLHYLIERPSFPAETRFYYADLYDLAAVPNRTTRDLIVNFIGLVYLFIGLFVLFKQGGSAPFVAHFAALCLAAFVFHFYRPTGAYEDLDLAIAFLDDTAFILFAPLFVHFCALYPTQQRFAARARWRVALIYVPAALLIFLTAVVYFVPPSRLIVSEPAIDWLYRARFIHFTVALIAGAALLVRRFIKSESAVVRQQLKWIVWGSALAITPFTLLYAISYLFEVSTAGSILGSSIEHRLTNLAILALVLIPLTFGNSVMRYRLMDVDIVVRRAVVYVLTTLTIALMIGAAVYVAYVAGLGALVGADATSGAITLRVTISVVILAVITMAALPIKNFLQEKTDRLFYGERYDLRSGLLDFGRTLSATTALEPLLNALTSRLQQVLGVERIAIFVEDARAPGGYRVMRAIGFSTAIVVPPDFREMIRTRSAQSGIVRTDDLESAAQDGYIRRELHYYVPCVVRGRMVAVIGLGRSADGALLSSEDLEILRTVSGYVAVAIENSLLYQEQKERAAELELLKEFNESIVESINIGLLAVDLDGRVMRCNSALEEMLGVVRDQAAGRRVEELFADEFAGTLHHVLGETGWQVADIRHVYKLHTATRAGRPLVLNVAIAPLRRADSAGRTGALIVLEDVTERARLEEQLQQREKLSSIGLLAAGIAHEINTPLTGVSSYTQMLLSTLPETDPKHALLQKIRRQTERASDIINNLLNFSRTGGATEFGEVDINRVLDDTLQLLEPQLRRSRIEVRRDYDPEIPKAYGNAGKLQQVFTNLLLNARDAILDGGSITLSTACDGELLVIEVIDTGIGISPENVIKIYDPFYTTKGVGRGTGLGLAVTYGIVQEHSGSIAVESTPGKGTKFRITLPKADERVRLQAAGD